MDPVIIIRETTIDGRPAFVASCENGPSDLLARGTAADARYDAARYVLATREFVAGRGWVLK